MKNRTLYADYLKRSKARLKALATLNAERSYADVVPEAQEIVELCSKGLLRAIGVEPARVHDVSDQLDAHLQNEFLGINEAVTELIKNSRSLRRDRELAFYGGEDFTPGEFYKDTDAKSAMQMAQHAVDTFSNFVGA